MMQALTPNDYASVMQEPGEPTRFCNMMFFRAHGRFPRDPSDLESLDIAALARQLEVTVPGKNTGEEALARLFYDLRAPE